MFPTYLPPICPPNQVQKALIDMENMFELLATRPRTLDAPGARPLRVTAGAVEFRRVVFGYHPANPVLKARRGAGAARARVALARPGFDRAAAFVCVAGGLAHTYARARARAHSQTQGVSFFVPGATTLAVVGSTGSGKSTILRCARARGGRAGWFWRAPDARLPRSAPRAGARCKRGVSRLPSHPCCRLLLRFYDPQSGAVLIDGADIRQARLDSVRAAIAVVPQVRRTCARGGRARAARAGGRARRRACGCVGLGALYPRPASRPPCRGRKQPNNY